MGRGNGGQGQLHLSFFSVVAQPKVFHLTAFFPVSTADGIGWLFWFSVRFGIPFPPPYLWLFRSGRAPLARIVSVMDYAKSFSLMLDLDIFSRFETFPLPASLILSLFLLQFLPHLLLLRALFPHLLFRLRAHFFARLPSLFAFAC